MGIYEGRFREADAEYFQAFNGWVLGMADVLYTVQAYVFDTLAADVTLTTLIGGASSPRIYQGSAPQGAVFPFVLVKHITSIPDLSKNGARRVWSQSLWEVTAVKDGRSYSAISTIVSRLDVLLHSDEPLNGPVLSFIRQMPVRRPAPPESGIIYTESGNQYVATVVAA